MEYQRNFGRQTQRLKEIDNNFQSYIVAYKKDIPFKEQMQRDVFSLSLQYEKDDLFPHTQPYRALSEIKAQLDTRLSTDKSSWTANQKEGYQWVVYSLEQFDKENTEYIAHFHSNIYNHIMKPEFLLRPVMRHNTDSFKKETMQNTHQ